ncbi:hypothetical protein ACFQGT_14510 [Natrialbaceae archaeon GCM10025810]|uniref:hypothetical protein n=1 Tax=Halovalidus salilacus TaxID=3075124 RepID=UPI00360AB337
MLTLESLIRFAEASARIRLSDTIDTEDAERVIEIVRGTLQDIGVDPETREFDADVVETGVSERLSEKMFGDRLKDLITTIEARNTEGAPEERVVERGTQEFNAKSSKITEEIQQLKTKGEVYEPVTDRLRTTQ